MQLFSSKVISFLYVCFFAVRLNAEVVDIYGFSGRREWRQDELTESFMQQLTKDECVLKTVQSLFYCDSDKCLRTMAGVVGDCKVYATGSIEDHCKHYQKDFFNRFCVEGGLSAKACQLLRVDYEVGCVRRFDYRD